MDIIDDLLFDFKKQLDELDEPIKTFCLVCFSIKFVNKFFEQLDVVRKELINGEKDG